MTKSEAEAALMAAAVRYVKAKITFGEGQSTLERPVEVDDASSSLEMAADDYVVAMLEEGLE